MDKITLRRAIRAGFEAKIGNIVQLTAGRDTLWVESFIDAIEASVRLAEARENLEAAATMLHDAINKISYGTTSVGIYGDTHIQVMVHKKGVIDRLRREFGNKFAGWKLEFKYIGQMRMAKSR